MHAVGLHHGMQALDHMRIHPWEVCALDEVLTHFCNLSIQMLLLFVLALVTKLPPLTEQHTNLRFTALTLAEQHTNLRFTALTLTEQHTIPHRTTLRFTT